MPNIKTNLKKANTRKKDGYQTSYLQFIPSLFHLRSQYQANLFRYCIVGFGLFAGENFYPIDFAYRFDATRYTNKTGKNRRPQQYRRTMSAEAKHHGKVQLAQQMIRGVWR